MWRAVKLVVSPLWFMGVYLMLVLLLPVALWLHERFDTVVLVFAGRHRRLVDVVRFRYDIPSLGLINMIVVWGLCHQLGFFYDRIVTARRTIDWTLLFGGLFGLPASSAAASIRARWSVCPARRRTWRRRRCASSRSCSSRPASSRSSGRGSRCG